MLLVDSLQLSVCFFVGPILAVPRVKRYIKKFNFCMPSSVVILRFLFWNCLKSCLVYKATILFGSKREDYYKSCSTAFKMSFNKSQFFVSAPSPRQMYRIIKTSLRIQKQRPRLPNPIERHQRSCFMPLWCRNMMPFLGRKAANH